MAALQPGTAAPDFSLASNTGATLTLASFRGRSTASRESPRHNRQSAVAFQVTATATHGFQFRRAPLQKVGDVNCVDRT